MILREKERKESFDDENEIFSNKKILRKCSNWTEIDDFPCEKDIQKFFTEGIFWLRTT